MTRILSLDDERSFLVLLGLILEPAGYVHSWTTDGNEALSLLRSEPPDLLTQDYMRPPPNGPDLYRQMKADASLRKIPVLFISSGHRPKFADEIRSTYGDEYLHKPFAPHDLLLAVTRFLSRHGKHVPTADERAARKKHVRVKLMREMNLTEEQFNRSWDGASDWLRGMTQGG